MITKNAKIIPHVKISMFTVKLLLYNSKTFISSLIFNSESESLLVNWLLTGISFPRNWPTSATRGQASLSDGGRETARNQNTRWR